MDLKGSLVDTNLKIYPSVVLLDYLKTISIEDGVPSNILKIIKGQDYLNNVKPNELIKPITVQLSKKDIENLNKIKNSFITKDTVPTAENELDDTTEKKENHKKIIDKDKKNLKQSAKSNYNDKNSQEERKGDFYLTTSDIDWLFVHLQKRKNDGEKDIPYLHTLLEGVYIEMPENRTIKRNPVLEARCVKLRAQQEARDYRKMTKSVDNVRMRFPEDSISYQLKQMNRQLIAIGQFIISIFAGFLFGFRGIEWMIGNLDFGFRMLLGVMCALVIALAEIYFLAKKLNEEMNIPETVQLGGPPKFAHGTPNYESKIPASAIDKEHQD